MKLRYYILVLLLAFGLTPLILAVLINLPLVVERTAMFYQKAYLQNLRADFRDLDQHLASRDEMIRMLAKLPGAGVILGDEGDEAQVDLARARYTGWINQMLGDQRDVIQILFVDRHGQERFWLQRSADTGEWRPTELPPEPPSRGFINAAVKLQAGEVMVSRIRVNPDAASRDPRNLLTLQLASPIGGAREANSLPLGLLLMTIDVGGLAKFYRDTLWVNHAGSYLDPGEPISAHPDAFADFPGLEAVFAEGKLALAKSTAGEPFLWVPMFLTEDAVPLWVGRPVDSSPIANFRDTLVARVLTIVCALILVVMLMARWIASRAERFGRELTEGVRHILRHGQTMRFSWSGPREVRELGEQLSELSSAHAEHLATERQHTRELEQSNRYKSEFLANVSHELRTPLNAILLLSKMLADRASGLDGEQRRQARVIHDAGSDLRAMIDNILDISRIEAHQVTVSLAWVEVRPMLEEVFTLTEPMFSAKALQLRLTIAADAPARIYSDRDKVRQILKNFLSNAAKFTHEGRVLIAASRADSERHALAISVTDTGIGIALGKEDIIFEAFRQADGSTRRRYGGTGLGLSISRELAGLLGGKIGLTSTLGRGSCFTLSLPLSVDPQSLAAVEILESHEAPVSAHLFPIDADDDEMPDLDSDGMADFRGLGVLLVERDVQCLVAVTTQLEALGFRVQTAADADEAIETLNEDAPCALLLLAAAAVPADTCDSIARIQASALSAAPPIVVIGWATDAVQHQYVAAGAAAFLPKPVAIGPLMRLLWTTLSQRTPLPT